MASSFNELFGLGSHSEDAALEGFWTLQDDAASTAVSDVTTNARNGTLEGGDNTSTKSTTGPNNWLTKALDFNGTDDRVNCGTACLNPVETANAFTIGAWANPDVTNVDQTVLGQFDGHLGANDSHRQLMLWLDTDGAGDGWAAAVVDAQQFSPEAFTNTGTDSTNASAATWQNVAATWDGTNIRVYKDGSESSAASGALTIRAHSENLYIADYGDPIGRWFNGKIAGAFIFSRALTAAEVANLANGPEPVNTSAPSISGSQEEGQTLTCASGTWGLPSPFDSGSNGAITYTYQWTRSDDGIGTSEANIAGATSSTYTLQAADVGKFIRCLVAASNETGGNDPSADTNTSFTGAIAASGGGDITPPTLSAASVTTDRATSISLSVSTDEDNGTLYWFVSTSATPPSAADLKAGTGAVDFGSQVVSATGVQAIADVSGLTASTTYYGYFLHRDAATNESSIVSDSVTTNALPAAPLVSSVVMDADGLGGTITFDQPVVGDNTGFTLEDEFGKNKNITSITGSGTTRTFDCDVCHSGVSLLLQYDSLTGNLTYDTVAMADLVDFNVDESAITFTARITTNTTSSTKTEGFGIYSFNGRRTTRGSGVAAQHRFVWDITSYPAGFTYMTTDPRPGATLGDTINLRDGDWEGFSFSFPMTHAGDYTVRLRVTDRDGNVSTATSTVTVAAQSSPTVIWLDGNASGANDGTTKADAYTDPDTAATAFIATGGNAILRIVGGQTYAPNGVASMNGQGNWRIEWDGTGVTEPIIDKVAGTNWINCYSENLTIQDIYFTNSADDNTQIALVFQNGANVGAADCALIRGGLTGGKMQSYIEGTFSATHRILLFNLDNEVVCSSYCGAGNFGTTDQMDVVGGVYGPNNGERPFRISNGSSTFVATHIKAAGKDCIRFQNGSWNSVHRCRMLVDPTLASHVSAASSCVLLGEDSGTPENTRVTSSYLVTSGDAQAPVRTTGLGTYTSGERGALVVQNCWLQASGTAGPGLVTMGDLHHCYFDGNTCRYEGNDVNFPVSVFALTAGRVSHNIVDTMTTQSSAVNNKLLNVGSNIAVASNEFSGRSNVLSSTPYQKNGTSYNLANFNALSDVSGQDENDYTFNASLVPNAYVITTTPAGLFSDYYTAARGVNSAIGAVSSIGMGTPPTATTGTSSNVTATTADVTGSASGEGTPVDSVGFVWGTSSNPTGNFTVGEEGLGDPFSIVGTLTGLPDNTLIYWRLAITTAAGTAYGDDATFTTLDDPAPTITSVRFAEGGTRIRVAHSEAVTGTTGYSVDSGTITYVSGEGTGVYLFSFTGTPTTLSYTPGSVVDSISQALGASGPTEIDPEPQSDGVFKFVILRV